MAEEQELLIRLSLPADPGSNEWARWWEQSDGPGVMAVVALDLDHLPALREGGPCEVCFTVERLPLAVLLNRNQRKLLRPIERDVTHGQLRAHCDEIIKREVAEAGSVQAWTGYWRRFEQAKAAESPESRAAVDEEAARVWRTAE